MPCQDCGMNHGIWNCPEFNRRRVAYRWKVAKQKQLCYRCLAQGHQGKACPRSRPCGQDGCTDLHHRLLHKEEYTKQLSVSLDNIELRRIEETASNPRLQDMKPYSTDRDSCPTEGKEQTTMVTQNNIMKTFIGLRTVPVILKNGEHSLKINALLDDARTESYINADVASELGLQGRPEKMTVIVLNGQVEIFETSSISVELISIMNNVSTRINACTVDRVTGNMPIIEWNKYKNQWPHLRNIDFHTSATRPIVDMLLGLDCADLIYAMQEVRGKPGEPIARLTPLGWTCIGNISSDHQELCHANFAAYTYFINHRAEMEKINPTLKQLWEIEDAYSKHDVPTVCMKEQLAMKKVENTISFENQMDRVGVFWKTNGVAFAGNYELALSRLKNTEKIIFNIELSKLKKASNQQKAKQPRTEIKALQELKDSIAEKENKVTSLNLQQGEAENQIQRTRQDNCLEQEHAAELESKVETLQQTASQAVQTFETLTGTERRQHTQCQLLQGTLDSVTQELSHKYDQMSPLDVNLSGQKDGVAEFERELQVFREQRFEDREPDRDEVKADDRLTIQELETDRASLKQKLSKTYDAIQSAEKQFRIKGHNALILEKNEAKKDLRKLENKLQATLQKYEAETHKQHDNFETQNSVLTPEARQLASEQDCLRMLLDRKEKGMGLLQYNLNRQPFETDVHIGNEEICNLQEELHTLKLDIDSNKGKLLPNADTVQKLTKEKGTTYQDSEGMCSSMLAKERQLNEVRDRSEDKMVHITECLRLEQDKSTVYC